VAAAADSAQAMQRALDRYDQRSVAGRALVVLIEDRDSVEAVLLLP
jgi:hypothetical protein